MAKDKELLDHERAHSGVSGSKVRHGADATGKSPSAAIKPTAPALPKSDLYGFGSAYRGYDPYVKRPDKGEGAHTFEFSSYRAMHKFLNQVGGAPHPLGGKRTILTED